VQSDTTCETFLNLVYTSKVEAAREPPLPPLAQLEHRDVWLS